MDRRPPGLAWNRHDSAIWHTCDISTSALAGTLNERPLLSSPFPPQIAVDEQLLAQGPFELLTFHAVGNGSYRRDGGTFFATGRGGLAITAGVAAVRAAANRRRRAAAATDAIPSWRLVDQGTLWISTAGFYLETIRGLFPWGWGSVQSAQLCSPASTLVHGTTDGGPVGWIIRSDWAELIFVLWAFCRHPSHPMLRHGAWLPPGWVERCNAAGFAPPASALRLDRTRIGQEN